MTEQKKLKRRVRARMEKTGERYTAARRHVVHPDPEPEPEPDMSGLASDEAVERNTGRPRSEWFALLDTWGARERTHKEIARHLQSEHGVAGWWAQNLTVGYERARRLRAKHQGPSGFTVGVSRTIGVPVERLFAAFTDDAERERHLPGLTPRTALPHRTARFDRPADGSRIVVGFEAKGPEKSTVVVQAERLRDAERAERAKEEWRGLLTDLKRSLEA